jgi:cellulose biosynthesis protein BcsQ
LSAALELKPKRVVFPIAGKGGVGKTTVMATLAEWYATTAYTADLFDMDPDNKAEGCFKALFAKAHKLPALESWTYDKLLGISLDSSADVILADLGAATGPSIDSVVSRLLQGNAGFGSRSSMDGSGCS